MSTNLLEEFFQSMRLINQMGRVARCESAAARAENPDFKRIWTEKADALRETYEQEVN
tara:strand:- start:354 stop:527 length:174 start_codon:yes stop_codon:yes gene_type:complete